MTFKMNPDCKNSTPGSTKAALGAVGGDFSPQVSLTSLKKQVKDREIIQQEFTAFVSPIRKRFKGARLVGAYTTRAVKYLLESVITLLLFCLVIPVFTIVAIILKFQDCLVRRYVSYARTCIPLRADDAVWQQDRPTNRHIIQALMLIEGAPDIDKLRQIIYKRLVYGKDESGDRMCPRLSQMIQKHFGYFVWKEDENFSMEKHVINWEGYLPKSLEELEDTLAEISVIPLSEFLSPWQFLVIPIPKENCFGLLLRIHHSVGDGVALTRVFVRNVYDVPPQAPEPKKFSTQQRLYMWCKAIFAGPFMVSKKFFSPADSSKIHGQELCGKKLVAWSKNVDLLLVKQVKNIAGTTVNDVMVSCLAGALHDYLEPEGNHETSKLEDMWASVPVDIRASSKSVKLKNKFALVFLRLPIVAKNAVDRLLATKQRMDAIKTSAEPWASAVTVQILMMFPEWVSKPLLDFFGSKMSCVLSNVPGPQKTLFLGGQKVIEALFWVPQRANIGVGLSISSYRGGIRVGVYSDESVIPNPKDLVRGFEQNFWQLVKELNINENNKL